MQNGQILLCPEIALKAAVTGGTGFIGRRLVSALAAAEHPVTLLSRKGSLSGNHGVRVVRGDLSRDDAPLADFVAGADVIFHCAGEFGDASAMRALHVEGTRRLIEAVKAEAAGRTIRWVQLSSVGAYGPPVGGAGEERVITELSPAAPRGEYEITKTLADELVLALGPAEWLTYSILRPSNVFGQGMPNASLRTLARAIRTGAFVYPGKSGAIATYIHVDDVVDALIACAVDERAKGEIFNLSNDCSVEELVEGLAAKMNARAPRLRLPEFPLRTAASLLDLFGSQRLSRAIDALTGRTRYSIVKLNRVLEFSPRRDVPATIGEIRD